MVEAELGYELERLYECVGVGPAQDAAVAGGSQPGRCRGADHPCRHSGPTGEVDDRQGSPLFQVERATVLPGVLYDQATEEARRGPVRQREAG